VTVSDQPLLTSFPGANTRLPIEAQVLDQLDILQPESLPNTPVSCLTLPEVGGFGRAAQAICLLDQVLKGFEIADIDSRLLLLDRLDANIQSFLSLVMTQCHQGQPGVFCAAMHIAIRSVHSLFSPVKFNSPFPFHYQKQWSNIPPNRALFTLHRHILDQPSQAIIANFIPQEEWNKRSQEALDTVTKMVVEIAEIPITASAANTPTKMIDSMPPIFPYIVRAALKHIHISAQREDVGWLRSEEGVLRTSLGKYFQRWGVNDNPTWA
jgi:hypothetical protein